MEDVDARDHEPEKLSTLQFHQGRKSGKRKAESRNGETRKHSPSINFAKDLVAADASPP